MKLGCSSSSYDDAFRAGRTELRDWLRLCADDLELDGVEIADRHVPTTEPLFLREVKKLCTDRQLTVAGIAVSAAAPAAFEPPARRIARWCDVAAFLGAPVVRVFAEAKPDEPPPADDGYIAGMLRRVFARGRPDARRAWSDATATLRAAADYASELGVTLALQNSRRHGLVASAWDLDHCLHDAGTPWLRACLDPVDLPPRDGIDRVMPRVVLMHARMHDVRDDGSDLFTHWPALLGTLQHSRYRGFVLIDYDGVEDCERAVPRIAAYLRGTLHALGRRQLLQPATPAVNGASADRAAPAEPAPGAITATP